MEGFPKKSEFRYKSEAVLGKIQALIGDGKNFHQDVRDRLIDIEILRQPTGLELAQVILEEYIDLRRKGDGMQFLVWHIGFRIQINDFGDNLGLITGYSSDTFWVDRDGNVIDDDDEIDVDSEVDDYDFMMQEEDFRYQMEEEDCKIGPDQESDILEMLKFA